MPSPKLAFVTFLCNGSDHHGFGWADQLLRAHRLGLSVASYMQDADIDRIAVTYNYGFPDVTVPPLTMAGWRVWNASHIPQESFALRPIFRDEPDARLHWPRSKHTRVQRRPDYNCTSLKLLAWNLTQYDRVMVSDTDNCMVEDPVPWMRRHRNHYFVATPQGLDRPYQGISSHLMYLQPSELVFRMLRDTATSRSFIPYTNSEQDIIETVFATRRDFPRLPRHRHDRNQPSCPRSRVFGAAADGASLLYNLTRRAAFHSTPRGITVGGRGRNHSRAAIQAAFAQAVARNQNTEELGGFFKSWR